MQTRKQDCTKQTVGRGGSGLTEAVAADATEMTVLPLAAPGSKGSGLLGGSDGGGFRGGPAVLALEFVGVIAG
jgi:hypothetical protein